MTTETSIMRRIMVAATKRNWRLFRNNVGMAWMGRSTVCRQPLAVTMLPGDVLIRNAKPVRFGIGGSGGSDLIGFAPQLITTADVGRQLPIFAAVEVKTKTGRVTPEQQAFLSFVSEYQGIARLARSVDDL